MKQKPSFPAQLDRPLTLSPKNPLSSSLFLSKNKELRTSLMRQPAQASGLGLDSLSVREAMVKKLASQIEDPVVLHAMGAVERHRFIDSALVNQAYEDTSLPIGFAQTISKPSVVARMIALMRQGQKLMITGKMGKVLEIGTGCGYQAAVLSKVATEVHSIERIRGLHEKAKHTLKTMHLSNVRLILGDGYLPCPDAGPYAGIIAAAVGEEIPQVWIDQLALGGRIVAPLTDHDAGIQRLVVVDKSEFGVVKQSFEIVHFVPLKSGVI